MFQALQISIYNGNVVATFFKKRKKNNEKKWRDKEIKNNYIREKEANNEYTENILMKQF